MRRGAAATGKQKIKKDITKKKLIIFAAMTLILLLAAAFARYLCPYDPNEQNLLLAQKPPGVEHWMGTDRFGRDMFSRVLAGSTISVYATLVLVAVVTVTGTLAGMICGWRGGVIDTVVMRVADLFLAFPSLVFALAVAGVLGGGIQNAVIAPGGDRLAEIRQACQRADHGAERSTLSDGGQACRQQHAETAF